MTSALAILIIVFVALLLMNVPIAFAIAIAATLAILSTGDVDTGFTVAQRMAAGIDSFPLLAIPFFILAGNLMGEGGMARRLVAAANVIVGRFRGGLAYVNVLTCMLFGSISGSAAAAASSIGGFMIPQMERKGYDRDFSVALTTTAATTGLIIPPSNIMIVYAVVAQNVSIAAIFMAGIVPGMIVGLLLMGTAALFCLGRNETQYAENAAETSDGSSQSTSTSTKVEGKKQPVAQPDPLGDMLRALPTLALVVIVLGGIFGGVFSATEASAVAVAYALVLFVIYARTDPSIQIKRLPAIVLASAKTTAIVLLLIAASGAMSWILAYEQIPQQVSAALLSLSENKIVLLLIMNITLLLVGTFLDMTPAVLIFTPIFLPMATKLGLDPVHLGVIMIANLCIGLCTPPVGTCLFVGCSVGNTTIARVTRPMLPFFAAMIVALMLITYVPELSMWLPRWLELV